jgi:hypothetical protein
MSELVSPSPPAPEAIHPPAISLRALGPWALFAAAMLVLLYLVGADEGALSVVPGRWVHEFVHDGRHLLGFPCH